MNPAWLSGAGAVLGGLGSLIGGSDGPPGGIDVSENRRYQKMLTDELTDRAQKLYALEPDRLKITTKGTVDAAKAAGLHPLFIMGGGSSIAPPIPVGGTPQTHHGDSGPDLVGLGQAVSQFARSRMTAQQREVHQLQVDHLKAQTEKEHAIASYYASEAGRNYQSNVTSTPMPEINQAPLQMRKSEGVPTYQENVPAPNMFVQQPDVVTSKRSNNPNIKSGSHAGFTEIEIRPGMKMLVPGNQDSLQEIMAEGSAAAYWMLYNINKAQYGEKHAKEVANIFIRGKDPTRSGGSGW